MSLDIESFLYNNFERVTPVPTKDGEFRVSPCPNCGSRKRKLYINTEIQKFQCFKCGPSFSGSIKKLFDAMGVEIRDYIIDDGMDDSHYILPKAEAAPVEKLKELPTEFRPVIGNNSVQGNSALSYLRNRGIADSLIAYYKMGFCFAGKYSNRVILPYYEEGKLVYFTGRDFTGNQDPKYLNPDWERNTFLFNYDRVVRGSLDFIVLVEGPMDVFSMPDHAVCLLGKSLSDKQLALLSRFKKIYVALDSDAKQEVYDVCNTLSQKYKNVYTVMIPEGEDPATLKEKMYALLTTATLYKSFKESTINNQHFLHLLKSARGRR